MSISSRLPELPNTPTIGRLGSGDLVIWANNLADGESDVIGRGVVDKASIG
jgi:hypothetical protein